MGVVKKKRPKRAVTYYECVKCGAANPDSHCPHCGGDGNRRKATKL